MNAEEYRGAVMLNEWGAVAVFKMGLGMRLLLCEEPGVALYRCAQAFDLQPAEAIALYDALTPRMAYLREAAKA
jgi:hypothetical protein